MRIVKRDDGFLLIAVLSCRVVIGNTRQMAGTGKQMRDNEEKQEYKFAINVF